LELSGVSRVFGVGRTAVTALDGIDLEVAKGERLAVVGPSGSGKSTLLTILGLLDQPTGGTYAVRGRLVREMNASQVDGLRAKTFGFVFQEFNLIPYLTVRENVEAAFAYHAPRIDVATAVAAMIEDVGLGDRADAEVALLSGGEKQRAAVARALVRRPGVVLADEPTGNLDRANASQVIDLLMDQASLETAVVVATHDPAVEARAGRVIRLARGRVVE
jgi:ABC-type lipoprotein export system ATPase subunit